VLGGAVVDLDLVYEMLDPGRGVKDDAEVWRAARRAAGAIAGVLLADGRDVVVEGDFRTAAKRSELAAGLPGAVDARWVTLRAGFEEALRRAQADPTRGLSRDPAFLRAHYDEDEPGLPDDLVLDTERLSLEACVRAVVRQPAAR
jgi:hypothetical protein